MRGNRLAAALLAWLLCGPATPARAGDGVVEINQVRALAGGITPGDSPGFPVLLTESGSYRLTGDLDLTAMSDTSAIVVQADDVAVDLGGFEIRGPTACSGMPPVCSPTGNGVGVLAFGSHANIVVRNGTVQGMWSAAVVVRGDSWVDGIRSHDDAGGAILVGEDSLVTRCSAYNTGALGIQTLNGSSVQQSTSRSNSASGIAINSGSLAFAITTHENGQYGLLAGSDSGYGLATFTADVSGATNIGQRIACAWEGAVVSCP